MSQYALIAIGYNREESMMRLLLSLAKAEYFDEEIDLIISIDNSGNDNVYKCAVNFKWMYGEKKIITYSERQGLRNHILRCGEFVNNYDAIAVFEDDVVVAPGFYQYMKEAVNFYKDDDQVAGISFYNHLWNVNTGMPFEPAYSQYDVYFLQFAQSWGQIWMKNQWNDFIRWYSKNNEEFDKQDNIPDFVSGWPKTSWLKYHIKYCIENDKYFVYPYRSLSTCYSEVGEHCGYKLTLFQVPMLQKTKIGYSFSKLTTCDAIKYDAFFEPVIDTIVNGINGVDICFDLYGYRRSYLNRRYIITPKNMPYKVLNSYALELKPHEVNIFNNIKGTDLFLYDSNFKEKIKKKADKSALRYYYRIYGKTKMLCELIFTNIKVHLKFKRK